MTVKYSIFAALLAGLCVTARADYSIVQGPTPPLASMQSGKIYYSMKAVPFKDWSAAEKNALNLYPGYVEPTISEMVDGIPTPTLEPLMMFVAKVSFTVDKPAAEIDLKKFLDVNLMQNIDNSLTVTALNPADVITYKDNKMSFRNPPTPDRWCPSDPEHSACLNTRFEVIPSFKGPIALILHSITDASDTSLSAESEVRIAKGSEIKNPGAIIQFTGINAPPAGVVSQTFFWFTHIAQFARTVAYIQPYQVQPSDPPKAVVTAYMVFALEQKWWNKKKGGFEGSKAFMGQSYLNVDYGILRGLPSFTQNAAISMANQF